jgi:hypothetical protein
MLALFGAFSFVYWNTRELCEISRYNEWPVPFSFCTVSNEEFENLAELLAKVGRLISNIFYVRARKSEELMYYFSDSLFITNWSSCIVKYES